MFGEISGREITDYYRDLMRFERLRFQKVFRPALKLKADVFKFLQFEECFRKARFRDGLV